MAVILSNLDMHPIFISLASSDYSLHAAVGSATVAMMGATAIVAPLMPMCIQILALKLLHWQLALGLLAVRLSLTPYFG